jgi:hypothetical protein
MAENAYTLRQLHQPWVANYCDRCRERDVDVALSDRETGLTIRLCVPCARFMLRCPVDRN